MPTYDYRCPGCKAEREITCSIDERNRQRCHCGHSLEKIFKPGNLVVDQTLGFYDEKLGSFLGSSADRRRICKEKGLEPITGRSVLDQVKPRRRADNPYREQISRAVHQIGLPSQGRRT